MPANDPAADWKSINADLCRHVEVAFKGPGTWRERMRASLAAALAYLAEDEERAYLYVEDALPAVHLVQQRREAGMRRLSEMIDEGRGESGHADRLSSDVAVAIAGGVWYRVAHQIRSGEAAALPGDLPVLMYFVVSPYLGLAAAREELHRPRG